MGLREWIMLITLSILWGGSYFANAIAVQELPTFFLVALRVSLAAMALYLILKIMGQSMPTDRVSWLAFLGMGLLNNAIPFTLIVWGQSHIASGLASILNAATPLFTVLVAHVFTADEKLSTNRILGVLVGFSGVAFMIGMDSLSSLGDQLWAQLACLGATLSYAFSGVWGRRFKRMGIKPLATATGQMTAATLFLIPVALVVDQPWTIDMPSYRTIGAVLFVAFFATAIAYLLFFRILAAAGATNIMLVTLLVPISAILLGVSFLNEVLQAKHFIGMAMIALGLAAIDGRLIKIMSGRIRKST